ncbi:MAG: hypothetical protein MJZ28_11650 [Paludibacteraceae bacterium]|nr:hypothetical protein [Paludibacteraceae bacterium]
MKRLLASLFGTRNRQNLDTTKEQATVNATDSVLSIRRVAVPYWGWLRGRGLYTNAWCFRVVSILLYRLCRASSVRLVNESIPRFFLCFFFGDWEELFINLYMKRLNFYLSGLLICFFCLMTSCESPQVYHQSESDFKTHLREDFYSITELKLKENIEDRFDWLSLPRMLWQTLFTSDTKRRIAAENALIDGISRDDLQNYINGEITIFNKYNFERKRLNKVSLTSMSGHIVTDEVWELINEREWMEWKDLVGGALVAVIGGFIVGFIIGFVIGLLGGPLALVTAPAFGIIVDLIVLGIYAYFTSDMFVEQDALIQNKVLENFNLWISNQEALTNLFM